MKWKLLIALASVAFFVGMTIFGTEVKRDKGIGPIKSMPLGKLDMNLAKSGKNIFDNKCALCHSLDSKKIGPPLRDISKVETPEFIMNLLLNTTVMQQQNEKIKQLIKQYNNILMVDYKLSHNDARSVLEYLRAVTEKKLN